LQAAHVVFENWLWALVYGEAEIGNTQLRTLRIIKKVWFSKKK